MKKILICLLTVFVAAGSLCALDISVGGGIGSAIFQVPSISPQGNYITLQASPVFSVEADFDFGDIGLLSVLDYTFCSNKSYTDAGIVTGRDDLIDFYIVPYFSWENDRWTYSLGPLFGLYFEHTITEDPAYTGNTYYLSSSTSLLWGSAFDFQLKMQKHISAYINIPFVYCASLLANKDIYMDEESHYAEYFGVFKAISLHPRIGVLYKF